MPNLIITIDLKGSTKRLVEFKPNMVNKLIKNSVIYFPKTFKLDNSNILKALSGRSSDISDILTDITMYNTLVEYNNALPSKTDTPIDIIKHNSNFMRKLWFVNNSKITIQEGLVYNKRQLINNNAYVIVSSKEGALAIKRTKLTSMDKDTYEMKVELIVSKETSTAAKFALTCPDKRDKIDELYKELFNTSNKFFSKRDNVTNNRYSNVPRMFENSSSSRNPSRFNPYDKIARSQHPHYNHLIQDPRRQHPHYNHLIQDPRRQHPHYNHLIQIARNQQSRDRKGTKGGTIRQTKYKRNRKRTRKRRQSKYI